MFEKTSPAVEETAPDDETSHVVDVTNPDDKMLPALELNDPIRPRDSLSSKDHDPLNISGVFLQKVDYHLSLDLFVSLVHDKFEVVFVQVFAH